MGWVLRRSTDRTNPTLAGGIYGFYKTAGRGVFWYFDGARVRFILFIGDGGRYGLGDLSEVSYRKIPIAPEDLKYHRGRLTKQIEPHSVTAVDASGNRLTSAAHPFVDGNEVRLQSRGGTLPAPILSTKKYLVASKTINTFQLKETADGDPIDLMTIGSGEITVWRANAGFDDPDQGLPDFCPQVETTFSGIAYIEGKLPAEYNTDEEPSWSDFRVGGMGRLLMDYDATGAETGLVTTNVDLLTNPALCDADCLLVDYQKPKSRIDWSSWYALRTASLVKVVQAPDFSQPGSGFVGKYFAFTGTPDFTGTPIFLRRDATVDFDFAFEIPAPELPSSYYCIEWEGWVVPKYTENYAFKVSHNDGARLFLNGVEQFNNGAVAVDSATYAATAEVPIKVKIQFWNDAGEGNCNFLWSSPSQTEQAVPVQALYELSTTVNRYQYSGAAASPIEAADYHEQIMKRVPGWDWTDANGLITYLPPDRPVAFDFVFDAEDDDQPATFFAASFQKNRRPRRDRKNFVLYSFRNQLLSYFPEEFVEENRQRLRELQGGAPNNDAPGDLLVMTRSLAQRIADLDMKINSDPAADLSLDAGKASGVVKKKMLVRVRNIVKGDKRIEDTYCLVNSLERSGNRLHFEMTPIVYPFYTDTVA